MGHSGPKCFRFQIIIETRRNRSNPVADETTFCRIFVILLEDDGLEVLQKVSEGAVSDRFPIFEVGLKKRGRKWRWCVCTAEGQAIMTGLENSRRAASYKGHSALFLLLLQAPYRVGRPDRVAQQARVRR